MCSRMSWIKKVINILDNALTDGLFWQEVDVLDAGFLALAEEPLS